VEADGETGGVLDPGDQLARRLRHDQPGHVLDTYGIGLQGRELAGHPHEPLDRVGGGDGVRDRTLEVPADVFDGRHRPLHVPDIVERVEDPEDLDSVLDGGRDKPVDNVVGIVAVSDQVLATEEHLDAGVRKALLQAAEALPGVLGDIPDAGVEGRAPPRLDRPEACLVEQAGKGEHVLSPESSGNERLMGVPQGSIGDK